jgi:hypothetical protein
LVEPNSKIMFVLMRMAGCSYRPDKIKYTLCSASFSTVHRPITAESTAH